MGELPGLESTTLATGLLFGSVTTSIVAMLLGYIEVTWVNIIGAVILSVIIGVVMFLLAKISENPESIFRVKNIGPVSVMALSYLPTITTISVGYILKMVTIREALVVYTIVSTLILVVSYQQVKHQTW